MKTVTYTFDMKCKQVEKPLSLEFESMEKVNLGRTGRDILTYDYTMNGRTYTDDISLKQKRLEDISEESYICEDIYNSKVYCVYTRVPTFDFGDREWDSKIIEYLMYDGKDINLVVLRGGYRIASLTFYRKLISADAVFLPYAQKLGWPIQGVVWTLERSKVK